MAVALAGGLQYERYQVPECPAQQRPLQQSLQTYAVEMRPGPVAALQ